MLSNLGGWDEDVEQLGRLVAAGNVQDEDVEQFIVAGNVLCTTASHIIGFRAALYPYQEIHLTLFIQLATAPPCMLHDPVNLLPP